MSQDKAIAGDVHASETERGDSDLSQSSSQPEVASIKELLRQTDDPFIRQYLLFKNEFAEFRHDTIRALPGFLVNNSSNVIGATQLVGEALYFKSSNVNQFIRDEHKGTWKAFVYPPVNVFEGVFKKSAFTISWRDILNPAKCAEEVGRFFDLKQAAKIDFARDGKLSNRWSARSGFSGMFSMAVATLLPEDKDDPAVREKMVTLAATNPLGYAGYRIGKGLMFPFTAGIRFIENLASPKENHHMGDGKREFAGIGMTLTGFFSVLAGFRQPRQLGNVWQYDFNKWQALGGMITTFAGGQLLMGIDNQQGWTNYGTTQFWRLTVLPQSIRERFVGDKGKDPKAEYYFGAQAVFQTKNLVASLIGGAEKKPDGTIVDQQALRRGIQQKIKADRTGSGHKDEVPATHIQDVAEHVPPEKTLAKGT